jgi:preprotein translocase subunit SecB
MESQTTKVETANIKIQVKTKTKETVTQTIIETVETGVGTHVEIADHGIQPELSMFRLEDVKSKDDSSVSLSNSINILFPVTR